MTDFHQMVNGFKRSLMINCTSLLPTLMKATKKNALGNKLAWKTLRKNIGNHARPALALYTLRSAIVKTRPGFHYWRKPMPKRTVILMQFRAALQGLPNFPQSYLHKS